MEVAEQPISRTDVDGVPVFSGPAEGPLRAALFFRVGRIDETLPTHGISHFVEHLALTTVGQQTYQYNGFVEGLLTGFVVAGSPDEIVDFYGRVTHALHGLPTERLENEARILETEQAGRKTGVVDALLAVRFGARSWGLSNYPEFGLKADASRVEQWRSQSFTRQNAAFLITGPLPERLRLELPAGSRLAVPQLPHPRYQLPAWMSMASPGVGVALLAERSTQLLAILHIAERRLQGRLRFQEGVSYQVGVNYLRLDGTSAHVTLFADTLPDSAPRARDGLLEVIDELAGKGPADSDIATEVDIARKSFQDPRQALGRLDAAMATELYGAPNPKRNEVLAELEGSSASDLARALAEAMETAIVVVPDGLTVESQRFQPVPEWSRERLRGRARKLRYFASARPNRLITAPEGVTYLLDPQRFVTIRYSEMAGVLHWNDGSRTLLADNGSRIHLRQADWQWGKRVIEDIDRRVAKDLVIPMGDRPKPDPLAIVNPMNPAMRIRRGILWVGAVIFWILVLGLGEGWVTGTGGQNAGPAALGYLVLALVCTIPLAMPYVREGIRGRRKRKN